MNSRTSNHKPLDEYKRFLLSRVTVNPSFVKFIEYYLALEEDVVNYCFHKIMVHNWSETNALLFNTIQEHFGATIIPVNTSTKGDIVSFYTTSLNLINKIIKFDFMFPYERTMYNIDVLINDKTAEELFGGHLKIDDIVSEVVNRRFSEKFKLDLSNFCEDQDFKEKRIDFYKITLLSYFKVLMLRMGRDTKELDLSHNNLNIPPLEILNFFIKGDLTAINLSYNNILSITDLFRVSSKIEKLWLEGNPLCDGLDATTYIKNLNAKFPRLSEIDGVKLNNLGWPLIRNFIPSDVLNRAKMVIDKFLTLYYTYYDSSTRKGIDGFYSEDAKLSISCKFNDVISVPHFAKHSRNILDTATKIVFRPSEHLFIGKKKINDVLSTLPQSAHDPTSFTVDVINFDKDMATIVIDGIFKEDSLFRRYRFRRTFVFRIEKYSLNTLYTIANDMFTLVTCTQEDTRNCFKVPSRHVHSLALRNPDSDEIDTIVKIFMHLTQLKRDEAEIRLKTCNWSIKEALMIFTSDFKNNIIKDERFIDSDEVSNLSSLIDDDID